MEKIEKILSVKIDSDLVQRLLEHYRELKQRFLLGQYEPSQLNCAKFAEVVMRVLEYITKGNYTSFDKNVSLNTLTKELELLSQDRFHVSIRIHIPRILRAIYDIRSKRGVAHVGKVNPNLMDATFVVSACDWIMAELIRLHYTEDISEAQKIVDSIVERKIPIVEEFGDDLKVLVPELKVADKILLILYKKHPNFVSTSNLQRWIRAAPGYVVRVLDTLDREAMIYRKGDSNIITQRGIRYVEKNLKKEI